MNAGISDRLTRRHTLGLLAAGALAGCLGGGADAEDDDGEDEDEASGTEGDGPGGDGGNGGDGASGTSLAGSCASAFGDTDQPYDPGSDSGWVVTFDYPMGGEIYYEDDTSRGSVASFGYIETELEGNYEHSLSVSQRGPAEDTDPDIGGTLLAEDDRYEDGGTVTVGGSERRVAVLRTDDISVIWSIGLLGPDDQTYRIEVQGSVGSGDPCPDAYEAVCECVVTSFERRESRRERQSVRPVSDLGLTRPVRPATTGSHRQGPHSHRSSASPARRGS
jgi:hypothetical protein